MLGGILVVACSHARPVPQGAGQALADAARLRGLAWKTTPRVETVTQLDPGVDVASPVVQQLAWLLTAMALVDATPSAAGHANQVHGHYAPAQNTVLVKPDAALQRAALLHESVHALQHQHFGVFRHAPVTPDAWLAWRALLEGDATLASMDGLLEDSGSFPLPNERAARASLAQLLVSQRAEQDVLDTALTLEGLAAVAALRRVGGNRLVDEALTHPPAGSHHILRPAGWVRGDGWVELAPFPAQLLTQSGHVVTADGAAGAFLAGWYLPRDIRDVARGWTGDRAVVLTRGEDEPALVWALVFEDEVAATRFVAGVYARASAPCVDLVRCDAGVPLWAEQEGRRVAVVRGLEPQQAEALVTAALQLPVKEIAQAPLHGAPWVDLPAREAHVDLIARARQMPAQVAPSRLSVTSVGARIPVTTPGWQLGKAKAEVVAQFRHAVDGDITVRVVPAAEGAPLGAYATAALGRTTPRGRAWMADGVRGVIKADANGAVLAVQRGGFVVCFIATGASAQLLDGVRFEALVAPGGEET